MTTIELRDKLNLMILNGHGDKTIAVEVGVDDDDFGRTEDHEIDDVWYYESDDLVLIDFNRYGV